MKQVIGVAVDTTREEPLFTADIWDVALTLEDWRERQMLNEQESFEILSKIIDPFAPTVAVSLGRYRPHISVREPTLSSVACDYLTGGQRRMGDYPAVRLLMPFMAHGVKFALRFHHCIATKIGDYLLEFEAFANAAGEVARAEPQRAAETQEVEHR